ncbi:MFS transporter [Plantactinospora endophytica]|uniref:MFS transporter n=1 Tax=Plantactinospora endophytica TaxID=673535 RepID=A0ABQ4E206_9ACTN|nr:MFS transporter [Plantactinospora endophytica]GIG88382.1 MFS transporter [Plantactinospora endophytica]
MTAAVPSGGRWYRFPGWRIVAALAVTQMFGYGILYYAFAVLLQPMAASLDASTAVLTGALTTALLAWAGLAVPVGRWLDRHGGRALMTTGSVLATGLLVAWSQVRTVVQLYLVLTGLGLAMAMVLYEAATAVLVSWFEPARRSRALLGMVVVGGFASTVFLPLTGQLVARYDWRTALLVLACGYGLVAVPLHAIVLRRPPRSAASAPRDDPAVRAAVVRAALRDGRFWCLAVAFVAHSGAMSTMTVHLVGFLVHRGHPATFAATVAGLLGVMSVTGRLLLAAAQRGVRLTTLVATIFGIQAVAAFCLPLVAAGRVGAGLAVTAFGLGFGVAGLAAPALLADRYGTAAFGSVAGLLATPVTLVRAVAPLGAAGLLQIAGGYPPVLAAVGGACCVAAVGILARSGTPGPPSLVERPLSERPPVGTPFRRRYWKLII